MINKYFGWQYYLHRQLLVFCECCPLIHILLSETRLQFCFWCHLGNSDLKNLRIQSLCFHYFMIQAKLTSACLCRSLCIPSSNSFWNDNFLLYLTWKYFFFYLLTSIIFQVKLAAWIFMWFYLRKKKLSTVSSMFLSYWCKACMQEKKID